MLSISGNTSGYRKVTSPALTEDLTYAQQQTLKGFPTGLLELIELGVVTAQWALALPKWRRYSLANQNICDLLANDILKPADIAKNFDELQLHILETRASVCANFSDSIISPEQYSALKRAQLETLVDPEFQFEINHPENQKKLADGVLTVEDLIQAFRSGSSPGSSGSNSLQSTASGSVLKSAQQELLKQLPVNLAALVDGRAVTARWALTLSAQLQHGFKIASIRDLLADGIISTAQFSTISADQLWMLLDSKFLLELKRSENQKKLKEGSVTLQDLMQIFRPESSSGTSSSSSASGSTSTTTPTGGLTQAQLQAYEKLPFTLIDLIVQGVVTREWALSLPSQLLIKLGKPNLCDLLADHIIDPLDVTHTFNSVQLVFLEYSPAARDLLRQKIFTAQQFAQLKRDQLEQLSGQEKQKLLASLWVPRL